VLPWSAASPAVPHAFGASPPYTVGVEEELFLVDRARHQVARVTDQVLARAPRFTRGRIVGKMCDGVVELAAPVCADAAEAAGSLRALRADVMATGQSRLMGAGLHPTARRGDVRHRGGRH
jgi:carboxylate-amine ligase